MRIHTVLMTMILVAGEAVAQMGLEGTTVTVKMDMPATSQGVDIRPMGGGLDFRKLNDRLREFGVGVHNGESIMITKVLVKKDHVEVHLGGGGFGTFSDRMAVAAATPVVPYETKSRREKDLEDEAKYSPDYWEREKARRRLDDERRARNRDNAQASVTNAQTRAAVEAQTQGKRAQAGSRFNIWYDSSLPPNAATPEGMMNALAKFVDFSEAAPLNSSPTPATSSGPSAASAIRKGMTVAQVEQILGPADNANKRMEGSMEVLVREYPAEDGQKVTTKFVGGVLIDYTIAAR